MKRPPLLAWIALAARLVLVVSFLGSIAYQGFVAFREGRPWLGLVIYGAGSILVAVVVIARARRQDISLRERIAERRRRRERGDRTERVHHFAPTLFKEIVDPEGRHKVEIYRNGDGTYGFDSYTFSDDPREMCWFPDLKDSHCIAPTAEIVEAEARGRLAWLATPGEPII